MSRLIPILLLLTACAEPVPCVPDGATGKVVSTGKTQINGRWCGRAGCTNSDRVDILSTVKIVGATNTWVCTIDDTRYSMLAPGDPIKGPWG